MLLVLWYALSTQYPSILVPSPVETFQALVLLIENGDLAKQLLLSITRMICGFTIGMCIGVSVGLCAGRYSTIYEAMKPVISFLLGIPPIILVVIIMVWVGTSPIIPVIVVSILVFPTFYLNTANGYRSINRQLLEMAVIYDKSSWQTLRHIIMPGLTVPIFTAISLASGGAVRTTIMAELLGASSGIGSALSMARINIDTPKVFAWTFVSILIILLIDYMLINPMKKYMMQWDLKEE